MLLECRTVLQERQFEAICTRLLNAKTHSKNACTALQNLKADKPKAVCIVACVSYVPVQNRTRFMKCSAAIEQMMLTA